MRRGSRRAGSRSSRAAAGARFGPADADLRATVTDPRPGRLARAAARQRRPRRGLRRRALGDRRPRRADPHRRPRAARASTACAAPSPARAALLHRLRRLVPENTRAGARENISAHYDLGNDLFAAFLDERMMYSCAYFPRPGASLEEAQVAKLDRICDAAAAAARTPTCWRSAPAGAGSASTPPASTAAG